jgi:hypothetical protein
MTRRIATLQSQLREIGRVRMGVQVTANGKTRPSKLKTFRLTSRSKKALDRAAEVYGGKVTRWEESTDPVEQYQVTIEAPFLDVLVPPNGYTSSFELWSGGGCLRRCDGETEELSGRPCEEVSTTRPDGTVLGPCPEGARERMAAAAKGEACKPTSRLRVLLPYLEEIGAWRLESHGYYAAIELSGMADFLDKAARMGYAYPARLRLEERRTTRPNEPRRDYIVPVLEIADRTPAQMLEHPEKPEVKAIGPGTVEMPRAEDPLSADVFEEANGGRAIEPLPFGEGELTLMEFQHLAKDKGVAIATAYDGRRLPDFTNVERYKLAEKIGLLG